LDLLLRFKQPTSGRIVIDGRRIDNVSLASLREQVGWVPQHATLFDGTILENVTYGGRRKRSSEALERAIQLSGVAAIAARLPDGLETRVGSSGEVLSHSQRQRVALARALVADPPILVVDELTSSLDAEADQALAEMLRALAQKKTLIVATHQLPTLAVADRIYVLEHGRLVEHGTHLELLERGAAYARLVGPRQWPVASGQ
jgi:ABC-type multidrug transport system fused ATPase/permease subunit